MNYTLSLRAEIHDEDIQMYGINESRTPPTQLYENADKTTGNENQIIVDELDWNANIDIIDQAISEATNKNVSHKNNNSNSNINNNTNNNSFMTSKTQAVCYPRMDIFQLILNSVRFHNKARSRFIIQIIYLSKQYK